MGKKIIVSLSLLLSSVINAQTYSINGILCPFPEAIDLGLPSGNKWANMNIGASSVNEVGGYYGWADPTGELTCQSYNWHNTTLDGAWNSTLFGGINPPRDISGTDLDIVTNKLGANWCLPSSDDFEELSDYCTFETDGTSIIVTGPNGNMIILPISGMWIWGGDVRYPQYEHVMKWASCFWASSITFPAPDDSTYWAQFNFPWADYACTGGDLFSTGYGDCCCYRNGMIPVRAILRGDNSGTTVINRKELRDIVIQTYDGELSIMGIDDNALIMVYNLFGQIVGKGVGFSGLAKIKTKLMSGDIALVKLNNKTIRVVMR